MIASRAKAVAHLFSDSFVNGDATANLKAFDSITRAIPAAQAVANGSELTLDLMDQMIDLVKPGRPDVLLMSKRTRRKLEVTVNGNGFEAFSECALVSWSSCTANDREAKVGVSYRTY